MALKYRWEGTDIQGKSVRVDIYDNLYMGAEIFPLNIMEKGIHLEQNEDEWLIGFGLTLDLLETPSDDYYSIVSGSVNERRIELYVDNDLIFEGEPEKSTFSSLVFENNNTVKVTFSDRIVGLKNRDFKILSFSNQKLMSIISGALNLININDDIFVNCDLYEKNAPISLNNSLYDKTFLSTQSFTRGDGDSYSLFEIVESIVASFHCVLFRRGNRVIIDNRNDYNQVSGDLKSYVRYYYPSYNTGYYSTLSDIIPSFTDLTFIGDVERSMNPNNKSLNITVEQMDVYAPSEGFETLRESALETGYFNSSYNVSNIRDLSFGKWGKSGDVNLVYHGENSSLVTEVQPDPTATGAGDIYDEYGYVSFARTIWQDQSARILFFRKTGVWNQTSGDTSAPYVLSKLTNGSQMTLQDYVSGAGTQTFDIVNVNYNYAYVFIAITVTHPDINVINYVFTQHKYAVKFGKDQYRDAIRGNILITDIYVKDGDRLVDEIRIGHNVANYLPTNNTTGAPALWYASSFDAISPEDDNSITVKFKGKVRANLGDELNHKRSWWFFLYILIEDADGNLWNLGRNGMHGHTLIDNFQTVINTSNHNLFAIEFSAGDEVVPPGIKVYEFNVSETVYLNNIFANLKQSQNKIYFGITPIYRRNEGKGQANKYYEYNYLDINVDYLELYDFSVDLPRSKDLNNNFILENTSLNKESEKKLNLLFGDKASIFYVNGYLYEDNFASRTSEWRRGSTDGYLGLGQMLLDEMYDKVAFDKDTYNFTTRNGYSFKPHSRVDVDGEIYVITRVSSNVLMSEYNVNMEKWR